MGIKVETEKSFMQLVVNYAKLKGYLVYHTYNSRKSEPGFPDLVLVKNGMVIFAELKLDNKDLTEAQGKWITELEKCVTADCNVVVEVWRPTSWELIQRTLK